MSPRVLFVSRSYPNRIIPQLGLWVEGLSRNVKELCKVRVIAPVPYFPPLPGFPEYIRFRQVPRRERLNGVEAIHPRFITGLGYLFHKFEHSTYFWGIRRQTELLRREFDFNIIHAHFTYPDGVVAARLGQKYRVPVVITEHAPWLPWMDDYPKVRHRAVWAAKNCAFHIAVSRYVRRTIVHFTDEPEKLRVIPVGVDNSIFYNPIEEVLPDPNQILFVGFMRHVKGVDVLFEAMRKLVKHRPSLRLVLVGGGYYRNYRLHEQKLRLMARELQIDDYVKFVGMKSHREVADLLSRSSLLVLPSRAESFGAVLIEALACGRPVVATRCGGPEDIVNESVGILVPKENVSALVEGIDKVLSNRAKYKPANLSRYAIDNFAWDKIALKTYDLYLEALNQFH